MQVTETLNEGLKRGYTITVTAAELDAKVQEKLLEAQPEVEIKGFRKGKVPLAILKKQFGPRILGDAMQDAIDGAMKDHFEKTGDRPALQPEVKMVGGEEWKEGSGCRGRDDLREPAADPGLRCHRNQAGKAGGES
jgi:trigger factor